MTDILFYHLSETSLERTLPDLLEKSLRRGWRVLVRGGQPERLASLDEHLWTYRDDSFLPHGMTDAPEQPILLSVERGNPNRADVLMLVGGATIDTGEAGDFERICLLFNGNDASETQSARDGWKAVVAAKLNAVYWAQEGGRWCKKSEISSA